MNSNRRLPQGFARYLAMALALGVSFGLLATPVEAGSISETTQKVLDYDAKGAKPAKNYRIAYLTECISNPYCQARLKGLEDAAAKYGFEFKIFDANFNPAEQLKMVQNAVTEGFDGYLFAPAATAPGCSMWKASRAMASASASISALVAKRASKKCTSFSGETATPPVA